MASDKLTLSDPPACSLAMSSKFKEHLRHSSLLTAHQELSPLQSPELSALGSLLPSSRSPSPQSRSPHHCGSSSRQCHSEALQMLLSDRSIFDA